MAFEESKLDRRRMDRIIAQNSEITQLKADLAEMSDAHSHSISLFLEQQRKLKADFDKFGGHHWDCPAHPDEHGFMLGGKCNCGFAEAEERWE